MRLISKIIIALVTVIIFFELLLLSIQKKHEGGQSHIVSKRSGEQKGWTTEKLVLITPLVSSSAFAIKQSSPRKSPSLQRPSVIHISVVVCANRAEEALNMLKSVAIFTSKPLYFHIHAEGLLHNKLKSGLSNWPLVIAGQAYYKIYHLNYPKGEIAEEEWKNLFKPCASQRLFLPSVLPTVDSVLYMDTDTLVLRPVEDIWEHFSKFDSKQLAAVAPEGEVEAIGWYHRFAQHPFYGKYGINSGVMLMNLTRMRQFRWSEKIIPIYKQYKQKITWGDQDILNVLFHNHPDLLYVFPCNWNFRADHCMYGSNCKAAEENGISVIHGSRQIFHNSKQPFFKAIYDTINNFAFEEPVISLVQKLQTNLASFNGTYCGKLAEHVLTLPRKYFGTQ